MGADTKGSGTARQRSDPRRVIPAEGGVEMREPVEPTSGGPGSDGRPGSSKNLVLLCEHFYPEMISTGMHMTELATRLAELGWRITVYTARPTWGTDGDEERSVPKEMVYEGVRILRVPTIGRQKGNLLSRTLSSVTFVLSVSWALVRRRRDYGGMVITTNPPFIGALGWLYSRLLRRPYLLIVYDVFPDFAISLGVLSPDSWIAKAWERLTRMTLAVAAVTVVIGRDMQDLVQRKMPPHLHDRIVMIPNWSDERRVHHVPAAANAFRQEHRLDGRFVVQYAGRLGQKHNLEPLIDAARLLSDTRALFQFVGDGDKRPKLEALAADLGLENVQFLPYQPMERLADMLSAADVAVVCLESGHTGISVPSKAYGVIASGTPIVGILDPDGEIGQMIKETGCGVLVDPVAEEIAAVIQDLMADPFKRSAMSAAALQTFLEKYTLSKAAQAYDAALSSMLDGSSNGGVRGIR
ncbi:MAG TPA: glycosyltransferase family 4 protein [Actinomycetota bacterium]|nr:glycosyltransferase family 4 protein [Actinomycetota bacterium]